MQEVYYLKRYSVRDVAGNITTADRVLSFINSKFISQVATLGIENDFVVDFSGNIYTASGGSTSDVTKITPAGVAYTFFASLSGPTVLKYYAGANTGKYIYVGGVKAIVKLQIHN